ncbi:SpoIID/LytB domain-containing protein [Calothrix parasitica NIES-267]|uniref:SpoIID/LytB domain-containing protein n=1 Tax=Calothrix parasitica NIES-267 TaxID=1973488 RepID=A0A1Z4LLE7_9CYAN|nr:SpoIID/LytB domain-containing protein [Calothrix parasitica NIES-267]
MKISLERLSFTVLTTSCLLGLTGASVPATKVSDVELKIGIVQRFASNPDDELILEPTEGDKLKLTFTNDKKLQTLVTANPVKIQTAMLPLTQPVLDERLVLGTFRTFETAEDSAEMWRKKGIEVEIAQPERWQVWAKREVYDTPLLRRLLLKSVKESGQKTAYVDSKVLRRVPQASWVLNGYRYNRNNLQISSSKNLIKVNNKSGESKSKRLYAGRLKLQPNAYGTYSLVNNVPLETYLRGVVPYEIGSRAPQAAMEAQAIIARTYALRNLRRFEVDDYQLCADTHCQVYYGLKGATEKTDKAIAATRSMVLTYKNVLVDALYSSTTGGVTASFDSVWNGEERPYLKPVIDTAQNVWDLSQRSLADEKNFRLFMSLNKGFNETDQKWFRWSRESSLENITKGLQKFLKVKNSPFAKFKTVKDIQVVERSKGGRILKLAVDTDIGTFHLYKDEVRSAFFAPRSTLFYLKELNKGTPGTWGYQFVGGGLGHGVGLSQIGAQNLANLGWKNGRILKFYYPGTQIQMLSDAVKVGK